MPEAENARVLHSLNEGEIAAPRRFLLRPWPFDGGANLYRRVKAAAVSAGP